MCLLSVVFFISFPGISSLQHKHSPGTLWLAMVTVSYIFTAHSPCKPSKYTKLKRVCSFWTALCQSSPVDPGQGEEEAPDRPWLHQPLRAGRSRVQADNSRCFPWQTVTFSSPLLFTQLDLSKANSRSHISEPDCSSQPGSGPAHSTHADAAWPGTRWHRSETRAHEPCRLTAQVRS